MPHVFLQNVEPHKVKFRVIGLLIVVQCYAAMLFLGQLFVDEPEGFAAVWLASGTALAALLLSHPKNWPFIVISIFAVNTLYYGANDYPWAVTLSFAVANVIESVTGGWLMRRMAGARADFTRLADVFGLIVVAFIIAPVTTFLGAIVSEVSLSTIYVFQWNSWWLANGLGIVLMTPLLVIGITHIRTWKFPAWPRLFEGALLFAGLIGLGLFVFGAKNPGQLAITRPFLLFPLMIWAAFRFGPGGAASASAILALIVLGFTATDQETFNLGTSINSQRLVSIQLYLNVLALTGLILAIVVEERKRAQEALVQKSKELEDFFNASIDLKFIANAEGRFLRLNGEWENVLDYSITELIGHHFLDFVQEEDRPEAIKILVELSTRPHSINFTNRYRHRDGSYHWLEWRILSDEQKLYASARDITARRQAESEIVRAKNAAEEANRAKDLFFSILAHDLRSPFASLLAMVEMMSDTENPLKPDEFLEFAHGLNQAVRRTLELLENLLTWARLQQHQITVTPVLFNLAGLADHVVHLLQPMAAQKDLELTHQIPPHTLATGDEQMVATVFRNLIGNAIKFTPQGGRVELSSRKLENDQIEVTVSDTGIGMEEEGIRKLFRLDKNHRRAGTAGEKGTGLGLILCKEFMEKNGGRIWVESEVGKGSHFKFTLPAEIPDKYLTKG